MTTWIAFLIGFAIVFFPSIIVLHIRQVRWHQRMRVLYPLIHDGSAAPKWWQVRRVWNFHDGERIDLHGLFPPYRNPDDDYPLSADSYRSYPSDN